MKSIGYHQTVKRGMAFMYASVLFLAFAVMATVLGEGLQLIKSPAKDEAENHSVVRIDGMSVCIGNKDAVSATKALSALAERLRKNKGYKIFYKTPGEMRPDIDEAWEEKFFSDLKNLMRRNGGQLFVWVARNDIKKTGYLEIPLEDTSK